MNLTTSEGILLDKLGSNQEPGAPYILPYHRKMAQLFVINIKS